MEPEVKEFEKQLGEITRKLHDELSSLRTNRPTAKLVEDIKVDYYGQLMPIKALGSIGINPPREITISVWDRNALQPLQKALESAGLGMTPNVDGNMIRLNLPPMTEERREEMSKLVRKNVEEARIKIRLLRDEVMKRVKEGEDKGEVSESDKFKLKERIQKIVDGENKKAEDLLQSKLKEIEE